MPTLIFWNVDAVASSTFPVEAHSTGARHVMFPNSIPGVLLVSGFDVSIVKLLIDDGEIKMPTTKDGKPAAPDPFMLVRKAIDDPRYSILQV